MVELIALELCCKMHTLGLIEGLAGAYKQLVFAVRSSSFVFLVVLAWPWAAPLLVDSGYDDTLAAAGLNDRIVRIGNLLLVER